MQPDVHTYRIDVRYEVGHLMVAIKLYTRNFESTGTGGESPCFGGFYGNQATFNIDKGDWITKIDLQNTGRIVGGITFFTKNGKKSDQYGNIGGTKMTIAPPTEKYRLTGVVGKSGAQVDKLGFIFTWTDWQLKDDHKHKHQITRVIYPEIWSNKHINFVNLFSLIDNNHAKLYINIYKILISTWSKIKKSN